MNNPVIFFPRRAVSFLIKIYQKTLSPDHGVLKVLFPDGYCKYDPSCSEYTRRAVLQYGAFTGVLRGLWRVLRCNPCSAGGKDLP